MLEVSFFQQEWDKVVSLAEQILALDSANVTAYRRLAGAYHAMKKPDEALKALKAAYALERLREAQEAFRRALQLDANYVPAQRAYQRVQAELLQSGRGR